MTLVSVLTISLLCAAISCFILNYRRRQLIKTVQSLRGPNVLTFIKHGYHLLQVKYYGLFDTLLEVTEDFISPCRYWLANKLFIIIYEPDQIKTVLQNQHCMDKSIIYKFFKPLSGYGLLTAPEFIWTKKRKMFDPAFSRNKLLNYFDTFVNHSLQYMDKLKKIELNGKEVDLLQDILRCTLNIAFDNLIGIKLELHSDILSRWLKTIIRSKEIFRYRTYNILLFPDIIFNHTALGSELREKRKILNSLIDEMIQQRMKVLKLDTTKTEDKTLLDIIMEAGCEEESYDDIITMLGTATETTAITINFALFVLANLPEIQEKVYEEQLTIYGTETPRSVPIKYEDLQYMTYLERFIKETMRFFPILPVIGRQVAEDIRMGEYILPKGADVLLPIIKLHRDEKYWPNPLVFNPDRFLPENMKNTYWTYIPFSAGPRNCIGMKYAMIAMKVILATLTRTFVFKVDERIEIDKIKISMDAAIFPLKPLKVKIMKRDMPYDSVGIH